MNAICTFGALTSLMASGRFRCTDSVPGPLLDGAPFVPVRLAQIGAFIVPVIWGMSKDSTGSYHFGLTLIPLLFIASAMIAIYLRRQVRLKWLPVAPVLATA